MDTVIGLDAIQVPPPSKSLDFASHALGAVNGEALINGHGVGCAG